MLVSPVASVTSSQRNIYEQYFPPRDVTPVASVSDAPCPEAPLQWWYGNAHLTIKGEKNSSLGFFASFFRQCEDHEPTKESEFYDACTWALIDNESSKYYADGLLDSRALDQIRKRIDPQFTGKPTSHVEGALLDSINKGELPRPDRIMKKSAVYDPCPLHINYDDECILHAFDTDDGSRHYHFIHKNPVRDVSVDLVFVTTKLPILHGERGVVNGMYYYYFPSMEVTGRVCIAGVEKEVTGTGWYDREFGGSHTIAGRDALDGWAWFSLRLSNGGEISIYDVTDSVGKPLERIGVYTKAGEQRIVLSDIRMGVGSSWTSLITFLTYPELCTIEIPSIGLTCTVSPTFSAQEFVTVLVAGYGFFEGTMTGEGVQSGDHIHVTGFYERKCIPQYRDTNGLIKAVGNFVKNTLTVMYPLEAAESWLKDNAIGRHAYMLGSPCDKVCEALFRPVRYIIDRGGKSWRSLILVSCCNAISEDYFDCTKYIAMAELLHVGSLIIDDIQDESVIRRGGPTVHNTFGTATAINAGSACYFMAPRLAGIHSLPSEKSSRIYQLYIDLMCVGHAGQGLDIMGLDYLMEDVVATGNAQPLLEALRAIHIYKTGSAAGTICKMACILCDADPITSEVMENFGVQIGLAFQIVDDALNLKGVDGDLKEVAEDIKNGKITYPVAHALRRLGLAERETLWRTLQAKPQEAAAIKRVIDLIVSTDAIDDCLLEARSIIEDNWCLLDPHLAPSHSKNVMHTFCKYLVERTF